jgi:hypothetical protein
LEAEAAAVDVGDGPEVIGGGAAEQWGHERAVWRDLVRAVDAFVVFDQLSNADW